MSKRETITDDDLRTTIYAFLVYTARSVGQTVDKPSDGNELQLDPPVLLLLAFMYMLIAPQTIYTLAKGNKVGSYRTVARRLKDMEAAGYVQQTTDDKWELTEVADEYVGGYAEVLFTMKDKVRKIQRERDRLNTAAE